MSHLTNAQIQRNIAIYENNVSMKLNQMASLLENGKSFNQMATVIHDCLYWHEKKLFAIHELQVRESHVIDG